tara:strand:+ start:8537 stop:8767 length:231 start_codon:yes stop_codon:yes gene_type:complete
MYSELDVYKADKTKLKSMVSKYLGTTWQTRLAKEYPVSKAALTAWNTGRRKGGKAEDMVRKALIDFRELVLSDSEN